MLRTRCDDALRYATTQNQVGLRVPATKMTLRVMVLAVLTVAITIVVAGGCALLESSRGTLYPDYRTGSATLVEVSGVPNPVPDAPLTYQPPGFYSERDGAFVGFGDAAGRWTINFTQVSADGRRGHLWIDGPSWRLHGTLSEDCDMSLEPRPETAFRGSVECAALQVLEGDLESDGITATVVFDAHR